MLKLKACIYRYTGFYLASREENEYMESEAACRLMARFVQEEDLVTNWDDAEGLVIGTWQMKHGFYRPISMIRFNRPAFLWIIPARIVESYRAIKWDLEKWAGK